MNCLIGQNTRCAKTGCEIQKVFSGKSCEEGRVINIPYPTESMVKNEIISSKTKPVHVPNKRRRLFEEAKGICYLCQKPIVYYSQMSIDHVTPLCKGGSNDYSNLRATHASCNYKKGGKLLSELRLPFNF